MSVIGNLCVAVTIFLLIWWVYKVVYSLFFSPLRNIPGPLILQLFPFYHMIIVQFGRCAWEERRFHEVYGDTVRIGWDKVQLASEEAYRRIYLERGYLKAEFYEVFQLLGENLFTTTDADFHRKRKRTMAPSFSMPEVEALDSVIREKVISVAVKKVEEYANSAEKLDMFQLFGQISLDTIGVVGFGKSFDTLRNGAHQVEHWINAVLPYIFLSVYFPMSLLPISSKERLYSFTKEAIQQVKASCKNDSIIAKLISSKDPDTGLGLSDKELEDESILQIIAGSDSTSATMTWVLHHLLLHPNFYHGVVEELVSAFPENNHEITMADCRPGRLPLLDAAIKETMRIMPIAPGSLPRVVPKEGLEIHGYFIPSGTQVATNTLAMHTLPSIWGADAQVYNPERFLKFGDDIPIAYAPFSGGSRACIGRFLAMAEIRLTLATLLRKFDFIAENDAPLTPFSLLFVKPKENEYMCQARLRLN